MDAAIRTYRNAAKLEARDQLIDKHLGFVRQILGRLIVELPPGVDRENLEGAGILGLVEAAGRYEPEQGTSFTTFAYPRIRGAILDELRRNSPLPQELMKDWSKISKACHKLGETVTTAELARQTGLSVERIEKCLVAIRMTRPETWNEDLSPQRSEDQHNDEQLSRQEQADTLTKALESLPEQARIVITLYHFKEMTLKAIGEVIGLSESRVSRILAMTELKLKKMVEPSSSEDA